MYFQCKCNLKKDNKIRIAIEMADFCNTQLIINEGDISGLKGCKEKIVINCSQITILLRWSISAKSISDWLWNPTKMLPCLATLLLKVNRNYIHFYQPLFQSVLLSTIEPKYSKDFTNELYSSMFVFLYRLQLILGSNKEMVTFFSHYCQIEANGQNLQDNFNYILKNFYSLYIFLNNVQRLNIFALLIEKFRIYISKYENDECCKDILIEPQLVLTLINLINYEYNQCNSQKSDNLVHLLQALTEVVKKYVQLNPYHLSDYKLDYVMKQINN